MVAKVELTLVARHGARNVSRGKVCPKRGKNPENFEIGFKKPSPVQNN
jgi:hypothetical protein